MSATIIAHKDQILTGVPQTNTALSDDCPLGLVPPRIFKPNLSLTPHQNDRRDLAKLIQVRDFIIALTGRSGPPEIAPLDVFELQYNLNLLEGAYMVNKRGTVVHEAFQLPYFQACCQAAGRYPASQRRMRHRIITSLAHLEHTFTNLFRREFCLERFRNWWGITRKPEPHYSAIIELLGCTTLQSDAGITYIMLNFERSYDSESPETSLMKHFQFEITQLCQRVWCEAASNDLNIEEYVRTQILSLSF
jgi:hypothetical protein